MLIAYVAFFVGIYTAYLGVHNYLRHKRLLANGEKVLAKVVSVGENRQCRYYHITFESKDGSHDVRYKIRGKKVLLKPGAEVNYYFDPANPTFNYIEDGSSEIKTMVLYIFLGIVIVLMGGASMIEVAARSVSAG